MKMRYWLASVLWLAVQALAADAQACPPEGLKHSKSSRRRGRAVHASYKLINHGPSTLDAATVRVTLPPSADAHLAKAKGPRGGADARRVYVDGAIYWLGVTLPPKSRRRFSVKLKASACASGAANVAWDIYFTSANGTAYCPIGPATSQVGV